MPHRSPRDPVIVDAVRTPVGRFGGALKNVRPDDLAALCIRALVERTRLDPSRIEDVILGCANQAGEDNRNVARMAALIAGLPVTVAGQTVNRLCGSGLTAIASAAHAIRAGEGDVFIAGGTESMTRAPFVMAKAPAAYSREVSVFDTTLGWRFVNPALARLHAPLSMGETAENVARRYGLQRAELDAFACTSQRRWAAADAAGRFAAEMVPVPVPRKRLPPVLVDRDEHPRPDVTLEQLAELPPAFARDGVVTAGNSSGINDGAAAVLVVSRQTAETLGLEVMATIVSTAVHGVEPEFMGLGPIPASRKALARAGLTTADVDLVEINEAFAAQALPCIRELGLDPAIVNVNGGAIAIGHPLGSTGARLVATLVHEMRRRRAARGLVTMCIGVGQGIAAVLAAEP